MNCKNCEEELNENAIYCLNCGARVIKNRLTIKNLFAHAAEQYLNVDNRLLKTFWHLFVKPETVIDGYISGMRKRYVNPISYFAVALTLSGFLIFIIKKLDFYKTIMKNIPKMYDGSENPMVNSGLEDFTMEYSSVFFILYIPILTIPAWIVFLDKKYNLTEQITLSIYVLSQYSILSFFLSLSVIFLAPNHYLTLGYVTLFLTLVYHLYTIKSIFSLSFPQMFLRFLGYFPLVLIGYMMLSFGMVIAMMITGDISFQDFLTKK